MLGAHQIGAAISGPRIAGGNFMDITLFLTKSSQESIQKTSVQKASTQKICPKSPSNKSVQKSVQVCHFAIAIVLIGFASARPVLNTSTSSLNAFIWARWPCHMKGACNSTFAAGRVRSKQKKEIPRPAFPRKCQGKNFSAAGKWGRPRRGSNSF